MNNSLLKNGTACRGQQGVTLVELLIALLLGLLLTTGMIKVFAGNRTTYAFNQSLSRIQENGRFALDHIAYTTRMAGYKGCISNVAIHNNLTTPNNFRDDIEKGVQGYDSAGTGTGETYTAIATDPQASTDENAWAPALPPELDGKIIPGSDVLVVRSISGEAESLVSPFSDSAHLFVSPSHGFEIGEILVVTDCQKASIFQLTNVKDVGFGINLVHSNASFTPGNSISNWPADQEYGLGSEVARLLAYAFYVGETVDGPPALFQLRLQSGSTSTADFKSEELVSGIDSMQVRYGLDVNNDEAIDTWESASAAIDWTTVLSVEITLLARATEEYGTEYDTADYNLGGTQFNPVDDRRLRQVFSTTIGVRNRLP